ncbi:hypothetical protein [Streptomyces sp. NPDC008150]|uniref:hypothetical protein n=1 Tax=Streptomyces sp. NPDC008150 TaxID=3364816 RepID=UPI0036ED6603
MTAHKNTRDLAAALQSHAERTGINSSAVRGADWRLATVSAVNTDGTVTADGIKVRRLESYPFPFVGDVIVISQASSRNWVTPGRLSGGDAFTDFTPAVGGAPGTVWSVRTGWYFRIGPLVFACAYLGITSVGTGGTNIVTVDMPTDVYRGTRQVLPMHTESTGPNGSHVGDGQAVFFTSGSGPTSDRLRTSSNDGTNRDSNMTAADLIGGTITIQGWYRAS